MGEWRDCPPKNYESNFFHHDFVQFGKHHSRYKAILQSIVLSQQCCDVYFIFLVVVTSEPVMRPDCQILLKYPHLTFLPGSAPTLDTFSLDQS